LPDSSLVDTAQTEPTFREGLSILAVAIRTAPRVFAAAVAGSALYGTMTVGAAWAVGWATDHVVLPDLHSGSAPGTGLAAAGLLIIGVALAKVIGIYGRRLLAGVAAFRGQAVYRRKISDAYLRLPLSWHQRHPTGQLPLERQLRRRDGVPADDPAADELGRRRHADDGRGRHVPH